jgi:hypothetical protein
MGHVAVLAVAIGIFVGTLSLGRHRVPGTLDARTPAALVKTDKPA